jgi:hypothetical protein
LEKMMMMTMTTSDQEEVPLPYPQNWASSIFGGMLLIDIEEYEDLHRSEEFLMALIAKDLQNTELYEETAKEIGWGE